MVKVIHNAGFDASRLNKHCDFDSAPIFDTLLAACRAGERRFMRRIEKSYG